MLFSSALPGGRVVFYRTNGVEPGGWLSSARIDGGDERLVGDDATGTRRAADHDFGAVTGAGRLVFEAELHEGTAPQLFVVESNREVRRLTAAGTDTTTTAPYPSDRRGKSWSDLFPSCRCRRADRRS